MTQQALTYSLLSMVLFALAIPGAGTLHAQKCEPVEVAKLLASDGAAEDRFGSSVSIDDDTAIIGVVWDDEKGSFSGSAYVFTRCAGIWTQQAKLLPTDGAATDKFGSRVALSGDTAIMGADHDDDMGTDSGSAYVFRFNGLSWGQAAKLLPGDGAEGDRMGNSVSVWGAPP